MVGYGGLMLVADDGHVTTLAVDPAWHRHKLGTRLLLALRQRGDRPRAPRTSPSRCGRATTPPRRSTARFGFAPAGVRKGYYAETKEDAIVMWANDVDTPRLRRPPRPGWRPASRAPPSIEELDR